jgi:hypothetical protein
VTSNRNDLYVSGTGGLIGLIPGPIDEATLANWQADTAQDAASISADPQFIDPNGTARPAGVGLDAVDAVDAVLNLHVQGTSPCVGTGTPAGGIQNDIDNQLRNPTTPDIGADEVSPWTGANLSISKTADAASVSYPNQVGFTVRLNNAYPVSGLGISVNDNLPGVNGVNWSIDGANSDPGWVVTGTPPFQNLVYSPGTLPGNTMTKAHVVSNTTSASCGVLLNNTASFTSSNDGSGNASASVLVVGSALTTIFTETFDGVTVPNFPAGWTATNAAGTPSPLWVTSNSGAPAPPATSLPNAAFIDDPAFASDKRLNSPAIGITSPNAQLTFQQNRDLEINTSNPAIAFDGGVLEVSIAGGAFADVIAAGGSFVTGGYNTTVATTSFSSIAGRQAWSGATGAFVPTTVNLPAAAAGQSVVLSWRMVSDATVSKVGWRIDSISISDFPCPPQPTPTPSPSPTATAVPTVSPTPTSSPSPTATPTASPSPTETPTPSPTASPSPTETPTPAPTPTASPSPTETPTPVPTASPSPTDGVLISGNVFNCASPAPTATPPASPTPPAVPPVPGVMMTLSGSASGTTATDALGNYSFLVIPGGSYTVTPSKPALAPGTAGINTTDVLAIQRHFLGTILIPAGCRLSAADANLNGNVNVQDVLAVQRFFLGFSTGTASVGQYKFSPSSLSYPSIGINKPGQNYAMYIVGDVAGPFLNRP